VQWCLADALTYEEREEEVDEAPAVDDLDVGLAALADKHGWDKVVDSVARASRKG